MKVLRAEDLGLENIVRVIQQTESELGVALKDLQEAQERVDRARGYQKHRLRKIAVLLEALGGVTLVVADSVQVSLVDGEVQLSPWAPEPQPEA